MLTIIAALILVVLVVWFGRTVLRDHEASRRELEKANAKARAEMEQRQRLEDEEERRNYSPEEIEIRREAVRAHFTPGQGWEVSKALYAKADAMADERRRKLTEEAHL
ncbi:MAG TPA: hypothetical protein VK955_04610 [Xanthobacteraceae bacterium]|nr:hypothetical protein [Xanthobacteraceae bacterium]